MNRPMQPVGAVLAAAVLSVPGFALAHHSFAKFDNQRTIELEGEIVAVHWQNPHVHLTVRGSTGSGPIQDWDLETSSPGILRRSG